MLKAKAQGLNKMFSIPIWSPMQIKSEKLAKNVLKNILLIAMLHKSCLKKCEKHL